VPAERWDVSTLLEASRAIASRRRHGGFAACVEYFDSGAFGVSTAEAAAMDPQQRLLLEHGYDALRASQMDRVALQRTCR
jgi:acyl transferase domain-containing protein